MGHSPLQQCTMSNTAEEQKCSF